MWANEGTRVARKGAAAQLVGREPFLCLWRHVLQREIRKPVEHKRSQFWMEKGRLSRPRGGGDFDRRRSKVCSGRRVPDC